MSQYTFEELMKIIFEDCSQYEPEFIKKAKMLLRKVCPHANIIDDDIDYGLDGSRRIWYCETCYETIVPVELPPRVVSKVTSLSDKHK